MLFIESQIQARLVVLYSCFQNKWRSESTAYCLRKLQTIVVKELEWRFKRRIRCGNGDLLVTCLGSARIRGVHVGYVIRSSTYNERPFKDSFTGIWMPGLCVSASPPGNVFLISNICLNRGQQRPMENLLKLRITKPGSQVKLFSCWCPVHNLSLFHFLYFFFGIKLSLYLFSERRWWNGWTIFFPYFHNLMLHKYNVKQI